MIVIIGQGDKTGRRVAEAFCDEATSPAFADVLSTHFTTPFPTAGIHRNIADVCTVLSEPLSLYSNGVGTFVEPSAKFCQVISSRQCRIMCLHLSQ